MRNALLTVLLILFSAVLTACATTNQLYKMSKQGSEGLSCAEITQAFSAYEIDRQSAAALSVLAPLMGLATDAVALQNTASNAYYEQAKSAANVALLIQGCAAIP